MPGKTKEKERIVYPHRSGGQIIWEIVKIFFTGAIVIAAAAVMIFTIISVTLFDRNDRDIFGYKAFIVRTDSMKATDFAAGDLIVLKEVDPASLKAGDIIAFRSTDSASFGETFTHKIRKLTNTENGAPAFITYGTTTGVDDTYLVEHSQVQGKYQFAIPGVGTFFMFLKTVPGYICCILLPFMLLIIIQGIHSIKLFRQYKAEQVAAIEAKRLKEIEEMEAERERLAAERAENQRMLEELLRLKESMEKDTGL